MRIYRLSQSERDRIMLPVTGSGGYQSRLRAMQAAVEGRKLTVSDKEFSGWVSMYRQSRTGGAQQRAPFAMQADILTQLGDVMAAQKARDMAELAATQR